MSLYDENGWCWTSELKLIGGVWYRRWEYHGRMPDEIWRKETLKMEIVT